MIDHIYNYIKLLRPQQYYKNTLIFLGLIFSKKLFNTSLYFPLILGFITLCLISSTNYIINDLKDLEKDKKHPEKKSRPLAAGKIKPVEGIIIAIITFILSLGIALVLPVAEPIIKTRIWFFIMILAVFFTSQLYTYIFKNKTLFDVTFISLNYIWRVIAGVIIINVYLSPWVFALGFFFALFLALAKRRGHLVLMEGEAANHKKVYEIYTIPLIDHYINIVSTIMIIAWAIYVIEAPFTKTNTFTNTNISLLSIPLVTIIILKLVELMRTNDKYARKAELLFFDKEIVTLGFITVIIIIISIYWSAFPLPQWLENFFTL